MQYTVVFIILDWRSVVLYSASSAYRMIWMFFRRDVSFKNTYIEYGVL